MRVAIVHYWLVSHRGGERVVEALCEMFPDADIFTLVHDRKRTFGSISKHPIRTSFLQSFPFATRIYQSLLPLMPMALEQFDLRSYDLVISSESGPAKGVLTGPETCHVCYCHSPMRYAWNMYQDYWQGAGRIKRLLIPPLMNRIRQWDRLSADRVDYFVANSKNVARRIRKYYGRDAKVIYPPVDASSFSPGRDRGEFYLVVSQLVAYKRVDLAVAACSKLNKRLVVIGSGAELGKLRQLAGSSVIFLGSQPDDVVRDHYRRCRALLFPGEEDLGITPIEAQASGRPVIAYGKGGVLETVVGYRADVDTRPETSSGLFFEEQSLDSMMEALQRFEAVEALFDPVFIRSRVEVFDSSRFKSEMRDFIDQKLAEFLQAAGLS